MPQRILLVDDNKDIVTVLKGFLELKGFVVLDATSYDQALEIANIESFDLLMADIDLQGKSGIDLLRELREKSHDPFRAIAFSGFCSDEDQANALRTGFDSFFAKPFRMTDVLTRIASLRADS